MSRDYKQIIMETFVVANCPTTELSRLNKAIINSGDKFAEFEHIAVRYPNETEAFVFSVASDAGVSKGQIAFNSTSRKWAGLMTGREVQAAPYKMEPKTQCLSSITFTVDFVSRMNAPQDAQFNTEDMAKQFSLEFYNQAFTVGQIFGFVHNFGNRKVTFELKVKEMESVNLDVGTTPVEIGLTTANTIPMFTRAEGSTVILVGDKTGSMAAPRLFSQDWDFATMGVGGLSEQFNKIFRRAFASRLLPPQFAQSIGAEHVRGILLYGPPGTGKTLIARQIGTMLLAREPKIVNGPEVLNKYVGESEANIRNLFKEAEEEQAKAGLNSGLHMIIFDEIDAICKARGTSAGSAGVGDNVVNQLLSKIDGVNSLHNVLLVGMTNRRDLIDEALLRPGRLEVQIEIGLPSEEGRLEIFRIHTKKMQETGVLDPSVRLEELAALTKNYTGAEIAGLIKAARSLAVNRIVKADSKVELDKEMLSKIKITRDDFMYAMQHDVKPALGASEDQLKELARPIIQWDPIIESMQANLAGIIKQISRAEAEEERPYYVLLVGEPGAGLTTIAANMAKETSFPFIRVYQAKATAAKTETAKVQYMEKLFDDAARSELSCIVIDGLEVILDYCHIGPRFSNTSRAVFTTNKDLALPKGHRMLVICTCKYEQFLNDLLLSEVFDDIIKVPSLKNPDQVKSVFTYMNEIGDTTFTPIQQNSLINHLGSIPFQMGIKKLERLIKNAVRDEPESRVKLFLERMHMLKLIIRPSHLDQPFL